MKVNFITVAMAVVWTAYRIYIGNIASVSDSYRVRRSKGKNVDPNKVMYHLFFAVFTALLFVQRQFDWKPFITEFLSYGMWALAAFAFWLIAIFASFYRKEERIGHPVATYASILIILAIVVIQWPLWNGVIATVALVVGALVIHFLKMKHKTMKQEDWATLVLCAALLFQPHF
jgi:hypothetical protein